MNEMAMVGAGESPLRYSRMRLPPRLFSSNNGNVPKRIKLFSWFLFFGAILLTGCGKKAPPAPPPPLVLVAKAATRDVPVYKEWIGTLDGSENTEIRARVSGYLVKRTYSEGSFVKKGDPLFEIDPRPYETDLLKAKSNLAEGQANQVASQADESRNTELYKKQVISEKEYTENVQTNAAQGEKVAALAAAVKTAELNLSYCKISSPVEGIAGLSKAQVGDLVGSADNTVLTQVSTLDPIKIKFPVSEAEYLAGIKREQATLDLPIQERPERIEVSLADGSVFEKRAKLLSVDRQVQENAGTILITGIMENPGNILRPGFFARARIEVDTMKNAVLVPQRALTEVQGTFQIGVIGEDGKAEIRPVKVGEKIGQDIVIMSGLHAGETIVVEGVQKIKNGAPVDAKPWTPPPVADKPEAQHGPGAKREELPEPTPSPKGSSAEEKLEAQTAPAETAATPSSSPSPGGE